MTQHWLSDHIAEAYENWIVVNVLDVDIVHVGKMTPVQTFDDEMIVSIENGSVDARKQE